MRRNSSIKMLEGPHQPAAAVIVFALVVVPPPWQHKVPCMGVGQPFPPVTHYGWH